VRVVRGEPASPGWEGVAQAEGSARLLAAVEDSSARAAARSRPLAPGERLDPNRASADELSRLPGVGPSLAARIVERRERRPFRTLADLDSVAGVGPALLRRLAPHLTLRAAAVAPRVQRTEPMATGRAAPAVVELNHASAAELEALPGVGPSLAARIVEWRRRHGRFRSVDDLERVPGIGPSTVARVRATVRVTP
jgi:competence ComEA-like helix-hairpin-helix protein